MYEVTLYGVEESFQEFYKNMLEGLLDQVPSDSSVYSTIRVVHRNYMGILNIFSEGVRFVAKALAKTPQELGGVLGKQIQDQITEWRRTRFVEDDPTIWYEEPRDLQKKAFHGANDFK